MVKEKKSPENTHSPTEKYSLKFAPESLERFEDILARFAKLINDVVHASYIQRGAQEGDKIICNLRPITDEKEGTIVMPELFVVTKENIVRGHFILPNSQVEPDFSATALVHIPPEIFERAIEIATGTEINGQFYEIHSSDLCLKRDDISSNTEEYLDQTFRKLLSLIISTRKSVVEAMETTTPQNSDYI
jgi:hypothetical protein